MSLAAPFYVHPSDAPDAWARLVAGAELAFAVVNVSNGVGEHPDPAYVAVLAGGCATPLLGYVDLAYGRRPAASALAEVARWRDRYGVTGVFLDQVPSAVRQGSWTPDLVDAVRAAGGTYVAVNPGTWPAPETLLAADAVCTFEGSAREHARITSTAQTLPGQAASVWHLVHDCPAALQASVLARAGRSGASLGWATAGRLPNPWARLPRKW